MPGTEQSQQLPETVRAIFYHKSGSSGRTCFLKQKTGQVCGFEQLPKLSQVVDPGDKGYVDNEVVLHPSQLLSQACRVFGLQAMDLEIDRDYQERVDVAGQCLSIFLVRFTTIDPPFRLAQKVGASFISLTEARNLSPVELELLRRAYAVIMGG